MTYTQLFRDLTGTVKAVVLHGLDKARGGIWGKPQEMSREPRSLARRGFPLIVRSFCLLLPWLRPGPALPSSRKPSGCQVSSPELRQQALPVPQQEPLSRARLDAHSGPGASLPSTSFVFSLRQNPGRGPIRKHRQRWGGACGSGRVTPRCLMLQTAPLGALPLLLPAFASD